MARRLVLIGLLALLLGVWLGRNDPAVTHVQVERPLVVAPCGGGFSNRQTK
jgi:uncharacterized membrane protein